MIKRFKLFQIKHKEVHVPSEDYYAKRGDSQTDTFSLFDHGIVFDTEEEALEELEERFQNSSYENDEYVILPIYSRK